MHFLHSNFISKHEKKNNKRQENTENGNIAAQAESPKLSCLHERTECISCIPNGKDKIYRTQGQRLVRYFSQEI